MLGLGLDVGVPGILVLCAQCTGWMVGGLSTAPFPFGPGTTHARNISNFTTKNAMA